MQSIHYGRILPASFQPQFVHPLHTVEVWAAKEERVQLKIIRIAVKFELIPFVERQPFQNTKVLAGTN